MAVRLKDIKGLMFPPLPGLDPTEWHKGYRTGFDFLHFQQGECCVTLNREKLVKIIWRANDYYYYSWDGICSLNECCCQGRTNRCDFCLRRKCEKIADAIIAAESQLIECKQEGVGEK